MPKCLIVYFSQSGSTAKVAEHIASGLKVAGYQVELHNLRNRCVPPDVEEIDLLGIGSPIYTFRLPFNVADYLNALPPLNNLPVFSFNLYGSYCFDTGTQFRKMLAQKGARDMGYFSCHGEDVVLGYLQEGYLFSPNHPTQNELDEAQSFGKEVASRVAGNTASPSCRESSLPFIYRLERFLCNRWLVEHVMYRFFKVDKGRCDNCGLCVAVCPLGNISEVGENQLKWGDSCLMCFTCEMCCHAGAIRSLNDFAATKPFVRYNIRKACRDKSLDHLRVKYENGHTERLG